MQTITLRSRVGTDGVLHLDIPSDYANEDLDVSVTMRPVEMPSGRNGSDATWPPGFFESIVGGWKGEPLVREKTGPFELRDEL